MNNAAPKQKKCIREVYTISRDISHTGQSIPATAFYHSVPCGHPMPGTITIRSAPKVFQKSLWKKTASPCWQITIHKNCIAMMKQYYLGIDLGGTRIKMGVVSDGKVIARRIVPARSAHGLAAAFPQLEEEINGLMASLPEGSGTLAGIGLAFPGLVNTITKKILSTNAKYDDAPSLDLEQWVNRTWQVPFAIDNDARMATVGEWKYGAGTDTNDLVVMTIGTGIGTSAVIEGKLV